MGFILVQQTSVSGKRMKYRICLPPRGWRKRPAWHELPQNQDQRLRENQEADRELFDEVSQAEMPSGPKPQGLNSEEPDP